MRAIWYDRQGPATDVLQAGEMTDPVSGAAEVRVRMRCSGINPGDTKKRRGWLGSAMPIRGSSRTATELESSTRSAKPWTGAESAREYWVYGAQSYRPFGTAAQLTVVPADQAIQLPDNVPDEVGACLGIPGLTAHRAVFADGPVTGATILVNGVFGAVGALAAQLARWGGRR